MQLLWIGCLESESEFIEKGKKGYKLASAQISQENILAGIENVTGNIFDSINGSVVPHYPLYQDRKIKEVKWSHKVGAHDISVGFDNIKYINRLTCKRSMIEAGEKWVKDYWSGDDLYIFVYSMRSAPMETAYRIKKRIPSAKLFLIVTDLPAFMDLSENKLKYTLKKLDAIQIKRLMKCFSGFILYASKMAEYLNLKSGQWMLMEGLYDLNEAVNIYTSEKKRAIMYSGNTELRYGLDMLINAFSNIDDPGIELWITGGGQGDKHICECAKKDERIKSFGYLPSRKDVLEMQKKASFLVNMRLPTEEASAYCFPSKLLEYMASGTPVISFKLEGIPSEYYPYLITIPGTNIENIKNVIEYALNMDQATVESIGQKAKTFILENKNVHSQCERIVNFVFSKGD